VVPFRIWQRIMHAQLGVDVFFVTRHRALNDRLV
jgi:hypothetical protein